MDYRKILPVSLLAIGMLFLYHCKSTKIQEPELETSSDGDFILYVANQNSVADSVDINIYLNDQLAVSDYFYQDEKPRVFKFDLDPGDHEIRVESSKCEYKNLWEFRLKEKRWGFVEFWENEKPEQRVKLTFYDTPLSFD